MDDVSAQDILIVMIQKEKTIAMLSHQVTALIQENQALQAQVDKQSKEPVT